MLIRTVIRSVATTALLGAILTACAHDAAAPAAGGTIARQDAVAVGTRLSREVGTSLDAITLAGDPGLTGALGSAFARTAARPQDAASSASTPCPSVQNPADTDHDGIPDSATLTFALPQCESVTAGDTTEVTGIVQITDPVFSPPPTASAFGYKVSFSDLTVRFGATDVDSSFTETRNGAEVLLLGSQGLTQAHGISIVHQDHEGVAHVVDQWNATFTASPGQALTPGAPLPAGFFAAEGQTSWRRDAAAAQFQIETAIPLLYDPTCSETAANRIRSGEIHASLASPGRQAYVRIVFADCRAPLVTFVEEQS